MQLRLAVNHSKYAR